MYRTFLFLVVAFALVVAACSTSSESDTTTTTLGTTTTTHAAAPSTTTTVADTTTTSTTEAEVPAFPVTIDAPNGPVTIEQRPERIVSLSPTSTEVLFAVGAGEQVVAVDDQSNYPAGAPLTDLTGFEPNIEAIAGYEADLVVLMYDPGDVITGLEALGIPVIMHPAAASLDDAYRQIEQIGAATGHVADAALLVASMTEDIAKTVESSEGTDVTYYHELSPDLYTVTSSTFAGSLYAMFGMVNIADDADPDGFGYPQLSAEHILDADPLMIFLADTKCCDQTAEAIAERPGWGTLTAVEAGTVVELDDDIASRWGPRIVDFVASIADSLNVLQDA
jgi:iron complex transport system substrate-binding protein